MREFSTVLGYMYVFFFFFIQLRLEGSLPLLVSLGINGMHALRLVRPSNSQNGARDVGQVCLTPVLCAGRGAH